MAQYTSTVGLICNADHDVFSVVADELARRGCEVRFFEPGTHVDPEEIASLSVLLNKKAAPESFTALCTAERRGVSTWNGPTTLLLSARLVGHNALASVGARVPPVTFERPTGEYVAKTLFDWHDEADPERNGTGDFYQPLLPTDGMDHKYYAVDTGDDIIVTVLKARSKLGGEKEYVETVTPAPGPTGVLRRLVDRVGARALGVDFVVSDGEYVAVDVNPGMSFRNAEVESELVDSVLDCIEDGSTAGQSRTRPSEGVDPVVEYPS